MKKFLSDDFLLETGTARELYHQAAARMPIIDYHCHLPPSEIAENKKFKNLTNIWLDGDHYKWRAMRAFGVDEKYITGDASDREKFHKWAETVPYTVRNPLYHWSHLELRRYFGIEELLNPDTADAIYDDATEQLQKQEFSTRNLMRRMNVQVVCTTDDPVDSLEYHRQISEEDFEIQVLPAFRPDKAYNFADPETYNTYVDRLEEASGSSISTLDDLLAALEDRIDFFDRNGSILSDHGLEQLYYDDRRHSEIAPFFEEVRNGKPIDTGKINALRYRILIELGKMYHKRGWIQQYHLGALRNPRQRMMEQLGPDSGFDSIGDFSQAGNLAKFLDELDQTDQLAKTILYNLNPADNAVFATMAGNFNDGSVKGKMQYGSAWWYLDQIDGMEEQMNILSNMGLISTFIGMLTDSRSFLSYPRHEYFRRILCNLFGNDVENGELPNDMDLLKGIVEDICFNNAKEYFNFKIEQTVS